MSSRNLSLTVSFQAIDKLGGTIKRLSGGAKGLGKEYSRLRSDTKKLERAQADAAKAMALSKSIKANHSELDKLRRRMREVGAEIAATKKPAKALKDEFRDLRRQERYLANDTSRHSRELSSYQNNLRNAGIDVRHLADEEQRLSREIKHSRDALARKGKQLERMYKFQYRTSQVAVGAGVAGGAMTAGITTPLVMFGREAARAAMDAEELQSAFNVTFGSMSADMNRWAEKTGDVLGRSTQEMQQFANNFGIYFNKVADPKKAADLSKRFSVLAQDLSSFFNTAPEDSGAALMSGLAGESEPLRRYGVFLTEAKVKAMGLKLGLADTNGALSEEAKIMARQAIIWKETDKAHGDLIRTSDSTTNRLRAANAQWEELQVKVGKDLLPKLGPLIDVFSRLLDTFNSLSPGMQSFIIGAALILAIVGPILLGIAGLAAAIGALAPVIAVLSSAFVTVLPAIGTAIAGIIGAIGFIPLAIGALLAMAAYAVYKYWDQITATFWKIVDAIKQVWGVLPEWGKSIGKMLMEGLIMMLNPAILVNKLLDVAKRGMTAFQKYFGINSPSRLMMEMGGHLTAGLGKGIEASSQRPARAMGRMAAGVMAAGAMSLGPVSAPARQVRSAPVAAAPSGPVTIHVHAAPGMDTKELAREVRRELEAAQARRERSGYND